METDRYQTEFEFEKYPDLRNYILEIASSGRVPQNWAGFLQSLNEALTK